MVLVERRKSRIGVSQEERKDEKAGAGRQEGVREGIKEVPGAIAENADGD
jgi:hypothetical protein